MLTTIAYLLIAAAAVALTLVAARNWRGERFLCDDCKYNDPEACLKLERPHAVICHTYRKKD